VVDISVKSATLDKGPCTNFNRCLTFSGNNGVNNCTRADTSIGKLHSNVGPVYVEG
jgi:hypothetical protein